VILILSQRNIASCVSGFRKWQDPGRQVRKSEKAVKIFESITQKGVETNEATGEMPEVPIGMKRYGYLQFYS
jgi:hypothetical protein